MQKTHYPHLASKQDTVGMMHAPFSVIYEDDRLLVVDKPAGVPTMGVAQGKRSLLTDAQMYIRNKYNKTGDVYLGIVSRLDAPVTGVIVLARTRETTRHLIEHSRSGTVDKIYWAVVESEPEPESGECTDWLIPDKRHRKVHVGPAEADGAKKARLEYRTLRKVRGGVLLEVRLITGRKHQIRAQLAQLGLAIIGDRKYGSRRMLERGIGLHARQLRIEHPVSKTPLELTAPVPKSWLELGIGE